MDDDRVCNTSVLFDREGTLVASYRKIHLFDADPPGAVPSRESFLFTPGESVVTDLRQARVYVSVLGNERKREKTLQGLDSAHGVLQAKLATELRMKRTPQLAFEFDPSVQEGMRMSQLIDELAPEGRNEGEGE